MELTNLPSALWISIVLIIELFSAMFIFDYLMHHVRPIAIKVAGVLLMLAVFAGTVLFVDFLSTQRESILIANTSKVYTALENKEIVEINRKGSLYTVYYLEEDHDEIYAMNLNSHLIYMRLDEVEQDTIETKISMRLLRGRIIFKRPKRNRDELIKETAYLYSGHTRV